MSQKKESRKMAPPCRPPQSRVLVVVERRSVVVCATALCADSNVSDARVFRAEVRSQKINLANRFKRRLAVSGLAKNATVRTLPIERKAGAIALRPDEFKRA